MMRVTRASKPHGYPLGSYRIATAPEPNYELPEAAARTKKIPRNKIFPTACRIPVWPFVVVVKAGQRTPPEGLLQEKTCRNFW